MDPLAPQFDVSVILPVHNERGHLAQEIERIRGSLEDSAYTFEIIVIDDGSTDGSGEDLRQTDGIKLIQFNKNRGRARRARRAPMPPGDVSSSGPMST